MYSLNNCTKFELNWRSSLNKTHKKTAGNEERNTVNRVIYKEEYAEFSRHCNVYENGFITTCSTRQGVVVEISLSLMISKEFIE